MGFIKAFTGALGGSLADSWKDYYLPGEMRATDAVVLAVKKETNSGRGSNTKASENIITNGSKIIVPEGMALVTMQDGAVTAVILDAGGYIYSSEDVESKSFFAGEKFFETTIKQSWERFKFGGQPSVQQLAFYVNLKEIPNNKFGTQSSIYWDDAFLNSQAGAMVRGTYTIKITDPVLFIKNFVPASYLQADSESFDFADMDNDAATQLFNEVVASLSPAFSLYTNDPARGNRINKIQSDQLGFAMSLSEAVEANYNWKTERGLEIVKTAIISIEYDDATKQIMEDARKADALMGARGNSFMQQAVARGFQAAGENGGASNMAFMGMGINGAASSMGGFAQVQQPQNAEDPVQKLTKLKQMLDAGLITQEDYDKAKAKVLGV